MQDHEHTPLGTPYYGETFSTGAKNPEIQKFKKNVREVVSCRIRLHDILFCMFPTKPTGGHGQRYALGTP